MPIEIKELIIKMKVEETPTGNTNSVDLAALKSELLEEVKREVKKQLSTREER
jgi:hypothetical protein